MNTRRRHLHADPGFNCHTCGFLTEEPHWEDGKPLCRGCWLDYRGF